MKLPRRGFLHLAAGAAALPVMSRVARAQAYPTRPVTIIVFVPAGGAPDISTRLVGQSLSGRLGQSFVIDNRPGAGGNLALQAVARAAADGYTLLLLATPHPINVTLYERANVNVIRDIAPVAGISTGAMIMIVGPSPHFATVPELFSFAKANPGKINLTSSGAGNLSHLSGELFKMMTGIDVIHVPYKGAVQAHAGLMAGEVHLMFDAVGSALPHIQSGKLRALAVTTAKRIAALPDVPAVAEFVPGYEVTSWLGLGAPRNTPPEIVDILNKAVNSALSEAMIATRFHEIGSSPLFGSPTDLGIFIAEETEKWAKVVKSAGIKA